MIKSSNTANLNSEIVLGLVAAVGTNLNVVKDFLIDHLNKFAYTPHFIRLSSFLKELKQDNWLKTVLDDSSEAKRINSYMDAGNEVRNRTNRGDALALHAVLEITEKRQEIQKQSNAITRMAHILISLKHPEEIASLRKIYGTGFFLIGLYSTERERLDYLTKDKDIEENDAKDLIERDGKEENLLGQNTRDTFSLSDVFIRYDPGKVEQIKKEIWRFLDLIFGHPFITPNKDEHGMYFAYSASLRSGSLARQVGAAILSEKGDIIATGTNDVPCVNGGLYWPGDSDQRDHIKGYDTNDRQRKIIVEDVVERLFPSGNKPDCYTKKLRGSHIHKITEYGRAVHAEMEALLSCARIGVSPLRGTLYVTTFPCHNCAKHIIAAGIKRVVYVEPYPKSMAIELYRDEVAIEEEEVDANDKVKFEPFIGIGARCYVDLFSMGWSSGYEIVRKKMDGSGSIVDWCRDKASTRIPMVILSYIDIEKAYVADYKEKLISERREGVNVKTNCK